MVDPIVAAIYAAAPIIDLITIIIVAPVIEEVRVVKHSPKVTVIVVAARG